MRIVLTKMEGNYNTYSIINLLTDFLFKLIYANL